MDFLPSQFLLSVLLQIAFNFDNNYAQQRLEGLHPNIQMLIHPGSHLGTTVNWTHHDKVVCVDRAIVCAHISNTVSCLRRP